MLKARFLCRLDQNTPIFIRDGKINCGRMGGHCLVEAQCPYTDKEIGEIKVKCPHSDRNIITVQLGTVSVECACFRGSVKRGGCITGGCFLLGHRTKNECPFENTGQINSRMTV